jgi:Flp pilus assembly protein TadD
MRAAQKSKSDSGKPSSSARALALLVGLTALAFSPVLFAGYIRLDDYGHILENPSLRKISLAGLVGFWTDAYFGLYIPMTYSVWWLLAGIAHVLGTTLEQGAWLFHALNLVLHVANVVLVFFTLQMLLRLCRARLSALSDSTLRTVSLIAALFFALHPTQVETVAWISECKGELSLMLGLLGIWHYYRSPKKVLTALFFVAAMLAKPSAIVFPGILLLVNRILLGQGLKQSAALPSFFLLPLLPFAFMTKHLQPDLDMELVPSMGQRLTLVMDSLGFYVSKLLVPFPLALDYGCSPQYVLNHVGTWRLVTSMVVLLAGLGVTVHGLVRTPQWLSRGPWYSFVACGGAMVALSLAPVLGLVPFKFQDFSTVADHYLYASIFGVSVVVVGILIRFHATRKAVAVAAVVLTALAGLSLYQATQWQSNETLFTHTLKVNPRSYLAHYSIAAELFDAGRLDDGIAQNLLALEINPNYLHAEVAMGVAWMQKGDLQNAIDYYLAVLAKNPSFTGKRAPLVASIHNNLGTALHQVGRHAEGTEHFRKAVEVDPQSVNGHLNLGNAAFNDRHYLDAIAEYERALTLSPGDPAVEQQLARARYGARKALLDRASLPSPP